MDNSEILNTSNLHRDDNTDRLLRQFFTEHAFEVPDDGFSHRVKRGLPHRARRLNRLWIVICSVAAAILFVYFKGWLLLGRAIRELLISTLVGIVHQGPATTLLTLTALTLTFAYIFVSENKR